MQPDKQPEPEDVVWLPWATTEQILSELMTRPGMECYFLIKEKGEWVTYHSSGIPRKELFIMTQLVQADLFQEAWDNRKTPKKKKPPEDPSE